MSASKAAAYAYDANDNQTYWVEDSQTFTQTCNVENRLASVSLVNGT
jgi:glutathionylspermidine synthase